MYKSIFSKYFAMTTAIILLCFTVLGVVLLKFASDYWIKEKQDLLSVNAVKVADYIKKDGILLNQIYSINTEALTFMETTAQALDANVFLTTTSGQPKFVSASEGGFNQHEGNNVPKDIMDKIMDKKHMDGDADSAYYEVGRLGGMYDQTYYTAGVPVFHENGTKLGAVFVSVDAGGLNKYIWNMLQMYLWAAMIVLTLSFIIVYLTSYRLVKPLRQMAFAARRYGEGDFSFQVVVKGKDEVADLARSFNYMASSLASVEGMRRSFVANVSHELKTPMTTIAGFIDGILDGTVVPEKRNYYLNIVSNEVKRLSRLVKSMLDISRIDAGELKTNPAEIDLTDTMCRALLNFESGIEDKRIEVRGLEELAPVMVYADHDMIYQVIYNLTDNAVKFTNEGGYMQFQVYEEEGRAHLIIRNSGRGIPRTELNAIFDRFYKSDKSRSHDKRGVGLGLFIVQMLIELHGGEIVARSEENEYFEVEFWIPTHMKDKK